MKKFDICYICKKEKMIGYNDSKSSFNNLCKKCYEKEEDRKAKELNRKSLFKSLYTAGPTVCHTNLIKIKTTILIITFLTLSLAHNANAKGFYKSAEVYVFVASCSLNTGLPELESIKTCSCLMDEIRKNMSHEDYVKLNQALTNGELTQTQIVLKFAPYHQKCVK